VPGFACESKITNHHCTWLATNLRQERLDHDGNNNEERYPPLNNFSSLLCLAMIFVPMEIAGGNKPQA